MTINFQDPRLQRERQKMAALGPESGAIFDTAAATSKFANNDMMKQLALMRAGNQIRARRETFDLRQKDRINKLNLAQGKLDLRTDTFQHEKDEGKSAMMISALGLIPKAYMGYKAYQQSGQNAEDVIQLAKRLQMSTDKLGG
jgi:hypothetical protein